MLQVTINDKKFTIEKNAVNGNPLDWDMLDFKDGSFHILSNNKSYRASLIKLEEDKKSMLISVNDREYELALKDKFDILLESLGMNNLASAKVNMIKAPMPGLVLDIKVAVGDTIEKGNAVIVLEAMKMENMIKSPGEGVIKKVIVKKGEAVDKGQVMIELE